ncbi:MAG: flippase-like domain-containing protein [Verrucomicrobiae bacterium]|nr:flippase-like domain-containing protein [Verrucomicrobiae bacterium]
MKKIPLEKIKRIAFCTVLVLMVLGIWNMRQQLVDLLMKADWRYVAAAAVVAFIYLPLNASVWGLVLRSLGADVSRVRAGSLWIRCEAMRYLPGGIWGYASRVVEARRLGVSKGISAVSLSVELVITALSWGMVAVAGVLISGIGFELLAKILPGNLLAWMAVGAVAGTLGACLVSWKFGQRLRIFVRDQRRPALALRALAEYTGLNFFFGLGFFLTFRALAGDAAPDYFAATGVNAVAWFAGMLAVGVPAGLGVREGACFLMFQPFGMGETAAAAALLFRAVQMIVEFIVLGLASVLHSHSEAVVASAANAEPAP